LELSLGVTFAVLGAALLHASWNALIKSGRDPLLDTALISLAGSLIALPLLAVFPAPAPAAWPFMAISVSVHIGYYTALVGAYKAGDLSHGYPVMRGTAPLLVALSGWLWFGEALSPAAWAGVLLICGGVLSLGVVNGGASAKAGAWALMNALIIAVYTLADGAGVRVAGGGERLAGGAISYVVWLFFFMGLPFGLAVLALKRGALIAHARGQWRRAVAGAVMSKLSYGIALWAMTQAPVAIVAALRETSVIFAALLGAWFLKEGHLRQRLSGAAVVLAGLVALKL
jgi:phosphonate utilization associated putative membrane protein